jgi:ABC-type Fe3+-hydroxamate transport system substrate-binding protein
MEQTDAVSVKPGIVSFGPRRIVCLTEEPTETLYALGEQDRIVGISGFTVRPAIARREKPKVSAFTSAKIGEILKLKPDFVIGFSDIQADIASALIRRGIEVWISNHRSVEGIIDYVRRLGALVGAADKANAYADGLSRGLDEVSRVAAQLTHRPKVYFEEWDEPLISGIQWVVTISSQNARPNRWRSSASSKIRTRSFVAPRTSSSGRGAARNSSREKSLHDQDGTSFPQCAMATSTKSSHP